MITIDTTSRGFAIAKFKDRNGEACSLQKSSVATEDCIWLGRDAADKDPDTSAPLGGRMHLTQSQVADLLPFLRRFVLTGELYTQDPKPADMIDRLFMAELEGARDACTLDRGDDDAFRDLGDLLSRAIGVLKAIAVEQPTLSRAATDVLAERRGHVQREGWTSEHDDQHSDGSMASAAAAYCLGEPEHRTIAPAPGGRPGVATYIWRIWPWAAKWWKPKDRRQDLVRAGALIIAEIERLDRAEERAADHA